MWQKYSSLSFFARTIVLFVLLCAVIPVFSVKIISPETHANKTYPSPPIPRFNKVGLEFNLTAELILDTEFDESVNASNKLVLVAASPGKSADDKIRAYKLKRPEAIYFVIESSKAAPAVPGNWEYIVDGADKTILEKKITVFEVSLDAGKLFRKIIADDVNGTDPLIVNIIYEPNLWYDWIEYAPDLIAQVIIVGVGSGIVVILGTYKLIRFYQYVGPEMSIGQVTIIIEVLINLLRLIVYLIDPFSTRRIMPHLATSVYVTASTPFLIVTTFLIGLYWQEVLDNNSREIKVFVKKCRWPFLVTTIILIALSVTIGVLVATYNEVAAVSVIGVIFWIVEHLVVAIFLIVTSAKVLKRVAEGDERTGPSTLSRRITRTTQWVLVSAAIHILLVLAAILAAVLSVGNTAAGTYWMNFVVNMLSIGIGASHCMAFTARSLKKGGFDSTKAGRSLASSRVDSKSHIERSSIGSTSTPKKSNTTSVSKESDMPTTNGNGKEDSEPEEDDEEEEENEESEEGEDKEDGEDDEEDEEDDDEEEGEGESSKSGDKESSEGEGSAEDS